MTCCKFKALASYIHMPLYLLTFLVLFFASKVCAQTPFYGKQFGPEGTIITKIASDFNGNLYCGGSRSFRSSDSGTSWQLTLNSGIYCIAAGRNGHVYIGGANLLRSSDYGATWNTVMAPLFGFFDHQAITVDSKGSVYTATPLGIFKSDDQGLTFKSIIQFSNRNNTYDIYAGENGEIFFSTDWGIFRSWNNGVNWTYPEWGMQNMYSIRKHSKGALFIAGNRGVYRSDDNCRTWAKLYDCPDINSLTIDQEGTIYISTTGSGIIRSRDEGLSWQPVNSGLHLRKVNAVLADEGGTILAATDAGIYKSIDKGLNWFPSNKGLGRAMLSDFNILPDGSFLTATFGIVYKSTDSGLTWKEINDTVSISYINVIAVSPDGDIFIGGQKLLRSRDNGSTWEKMNGLPDEGFSSVAFLPEGQIVAARYAALYISEDKGNTWRLLYSPAYNHSGGITAVTFDKYSGMLYALFAGKFMSSDDRGKSWKDAYLTGMFNASDLAVNGVGHLFITDCTSGIYRSIDRGTSWEQLTGIGMKDNPELLFTQAAVNSNGYVYGSTKDGSIYCSADNGRSWSLVNNEFKGKVDLQGRYPAGIPQLFIDKSGYLYAPTPYDGIFKTSNSVAPEKLPNLFALHELPLGRHRISRDHDTLVNIFNIGSAPLNVSSVNFSDSEFRVNSSEFVIPPYQEHTSTVSYNLSSLGYKELSLHIESNTPAGPFSIKIRAYGYGIPILKLRTAQLDFQKADIGTYKVLPLHIHNEGDDTLKITGRKISEPFFSPGKINTIPPGKSAADTILFAGWLPVGKSTGKMIIYSNSPARADTAFLTGESAHLSVLDLLTDKIELNDVAVISTRNFFIDIANNGSDILTISEISSASKKIRVEKGPFTISPRSKIKIKVSYTPVSAGRDSCLLLFHNNSLSGIDTLIITANAVDKPGRADDTRPVFENSLFLNYPNPFNSYTQIGFSIEEESVVTLKVFNVTGQLIKVLVRGTLAAGMHNAEFNAEGIPSGAYIFELDVNNKYISRKKMLLVK